jgi:glutamate dehydrogenase (NADP+)
MSYIDDVFQSVKMRNSSEPEFLQAVEEVFKSIEPVIRMHPEYQKASLLERLVEPERVIMFRVPWVDRNGNVQVNRGFRVQFSSAIGPYKGGLRFHASVNLGIMKFLAFEQIFKNSLTTLPMGGGKGGSDFNPKGKTDMEVMNFCQSFMKELSKYIGQFTDVPAGDIGVGGREIGYLFGEYKRLRNEFTGVLTGKGLSWGGSLVRPEATGFGVTYFTREMLAAKGQTFSGKTVALSGFGNVTWGTAMKVTELGGKVITLSGPDGYIHDEAGVSGAKIDYLLELRASSNDVVRDYADKYKVPFYPGEKPWGVKADIVIPCATQNEIYIEDAKKIVANGTKFVTEGANMPCTNEAADYFHANGVVVGPAKAANAGGVATSGLEMSQNSMKITWSAKEVDARLDAIMVNIHKASKDAAETYGYGYNLVAGANIAGFLKVAGAMMDQGVV